MMPATLLSHTFEEAEVQRFLHPLVSSPPFGFRGGLVLENEVFSKLRQTRYWRPVDSFAADQIYEQYLDGEYIYGGPIYNHFGHFLSEMAHRVLPSKAIFQAKKWLFVSAQGELSKFEILPSYLKDFFLYFGISQDDLIIVDKNTKVANLHVVEAGSDFGGGPKPGYLEDLRDYALERGLKPMNQKSSRIFVSRAHMPVGGSFLGEAYIERQLNKEGFQSFYPEQHSFTEQMAVYRSSETVIFPEGSACHGTELLGEKELHRCVFLPRRENHLDIFSKVLRPRSQEYITLSPSLNLGSLVGPRNSTPTEHTAVSIFDIPKLLEFFRTNKIASFSDFSLSDYFETCENDLSRYIYFNVKRDRVTSVEAMHKVYSAFDAAKKALQI